MRRQYTDSSILYYTLLRLRDIVFSKTANIGGAFSWLIEGPLATYLTQLRGYLTEYIQDVY